VKKGKTRRSNR